MKKFLIALVALGVVSCGAGKAVKTDGPAVKKESTPHPIKLRRQDRENLQFVKLQRDTWNNALLIMQNEFIQRYKIANDESWDLDFEKGELVYLGKAPTPVPSPANTPQEK